ncbi:MAG: hypothetical protein AB1641_29015 [Thermodesulfobacteriota bacterium]
MALQRPNITQCVDGKDHGWMIVTEETDQGGARWEHRWCQKCGVLTQVTYNAQGEPIAVLNEDKTHYLVVPKILSLLIK